jgi:hypothetical protein
MEIKVRGATSVLVGLERVGLLGLDLAIEAARDSGLTGRDDLLDTMMPILLERNYVPPAAMADYRSAVWREYVRSRGEDISDLYSELEIEVRAEDGPETDRFLRVLRGVFAKHELKPIASLRPPSAEDRSPQLVIDDEVIVEGTLDPARISKAVGRRISHW